MPLKTGRSRAASRRIARYVQPASDTRTPVIALRQPLPIFEEQVRVIEKLRSLQVDIYIVTASIKWAVEPGARRPELPQACRRQKRATMERAKRAITVTRMPSTMMLSIALSRAGNPWMPAARRPSQPRATGTISMTT